MDSLLSAQGLLTWDGATAASLQAAAMSLAWASGSTLVMGLRWEFWLTAEPSRRPLHGDTPSSLATKKQTPPSLRTYPSAAELKVWHRNVGERKLALRRCAAI